MDLLVVDGASCDFRTGRLYGTFWDSIFETVDMQAAGITLPRHVNEPQPSTISLVVQSFVFSYMSVLDKLVRGIIEFGPLEPHQVRCL